MCVMSMIADQYHPTAPTYPAPMPMYPGQVPSTDWLQIPNTDQRWTPEKWAEFEKLLEQASKIDELTGQPDCEDPEKIAWMNEVRRALELEEHEVEDIDVHVSYGVSDAGSLSEHYADMNGNPAGGYSDGKGFDIQWQNGPLAVNGVRLEPNGAFVEEVIWAVIDRIEFYQGSKFHGIHNAVALGHLKAALEVLNERTRDREDRGVEGTHQK
jgi:hypothetical protein